MKNFDAKENPEFNQYWYSEHTIDTIVNELLFVGSQRTAFLSTPSVFFAADKAGVTGDLFDIDPQFTSPQSGNNCFAYDFNSQDLPEGLHHQYDSVVIDPPFITSEVLAAYARTVKLLLKPEGRIIISSIAENLDVLVDHLGQTIRSVSFKPCIPSLVYQYNLFINYSLLQGSGFARENPELKDDPRCENS